MKTTKISSAALLLGLLAGPALAQESLSTVVFAPGENGGALPVAQSFYGQSQPMETSIIDINDDGAAEIAVKFTEGCADDVCNTTILYYADSRWLEVFRDQTSTLQISSQIEQGMRELVTAENARWYWSHHQDFRARPDRGDLMSEVGEFSATLDQPELADPEIRNLIDPKKYTIDLNGDGAAETVVFSRDLLECGMAAACPVIIMSNTGQKIASLYVKEARIFVDGDRLYAMTGEGFTSYAFDGQSLTEIKNYGKSEVRG